MNETLHIALIQTALVWEDPEANRQLFQQHIESLSGNVDLVVLPEMFTSGFTMNADAVFETMEGTTIKWLQHLSSEKNVAICGSLVIKEHKQFYNRFVFVYPNGKLLYYDKRHTFTLAGEHEVYTAGNRKVVFEYQGWKICPQVCYDLRFPVWARNTEDYDVLIYVANWPAKRINAWDVLLQARAIENMSYCVGVNRVGVDGLDFEYVGHSAVYDPLGTQIVYSETDEVLHAMLYKKDVDVPRNKLKFLQDRDSFTVK